VGDLEDDVQELWRMRDKPDFSEDDGPPLKKENKEPKTTRLIDKVWPVDRTEAVKTKPVDVVPMKTHSKVFRDKQTNHKPYQLSIVDVTGKDTVKSNNTPRVVGNGTSGNPCVGWNPPGRPNPHMVILPY
nr:zinc finger, FYVE/PHD-type [Tanacetum cinerariifolium]